MAKKRRKRKLKPLRFKPQISSELKKLGQKVKDTWNRFTH